MSIILKRSTMKINKPFHKKIKKTNSYQYDQLVKFMVENPTFATYTMVTSAKDKILYRRLWEQLKVLLNMIGPPIRSTEEWKKVWVGYKHNIKNKCYLKQQNDQIQRAGGTALFKIINFSTNEIAVKNLVFNTTFGRPLFPDCTSPVNVHSPSSTTSVANSGEEEPQPTIKTELSDMFIDVITDETQPMIDTISPPPTKIPGNDDCLSLTSTTSQLNFFEEYEEIEKQLDKLKKEKIKILRQSAEIKQNLQEKLQELKERKFEVKCQQFKYKSRKLQLKKKELQMKEDGATKLRNHNKLNCVKP